MKLVAERASVISNLPTMLSLSCFSIRWAVIHLMEPTLDRENEEARVEDVKRKDGKNDHTTIQNVCRRKLTKSC